ncbi:MAG: antibiotic biosynthesis monooxygenase family protein [Cyanobacteria bacterium P01_D01_bin.2]
MTILDLENQLVTVIVLIKVKENQQAAVIDTVKKLFAIAKLQPGLVSANLHRSLDGVKVANYAQWESKEALAGFRRLPEARTLVASLQPLIDEMDAHRYEIIASESKVGTPRIQAGEYFVHFAEFRMPAENQPPMVELAKEHIGPAMSLDGLLSATFHRSLDGERVINYGQWENDQAISKLVQRSGFGQEDGYWTGLAENEFHLYEVLLTEKGEPS